MRPVSSKTSSASSSSSAAAAAAAAEEQFNDGNSFSCLQVCPASESRRLCLLLRGVSFVSSNAYQDRFYIVIVEAQIYTWSMTLITAALLVSSVLTWQQLVADNAIIPL